MEATLDFITNEAKNVKTFSRKKSEGKEKDRDPSPHFGLSPSKAKSVDKTTLKDVYAFVDIQKLDKNDEIRDQLGALGATVANKWVPTRVTHIIFEGGKKLTQERALQQGLPLLSPQWVTNCYNENKRIAEESFALSKGKKTSPPRESSPKPKKGSSKKNEDASDTESNTANGKSNKKSFKKDDEGYGTETVIDSEDEKGKTKAANKSKNQSAKTETSYIPATPEQDDDENDNISKKDDSKKDDSKKKPEEKEVIYESEGEQSDEDATVKKGANNKKSSRRIDDDDDDNKGNTTPPPKNVNKTSSVMETPKGKSQSTSDEKTPPFKASHSNASDRDGSPPLARAESESFNFDEEDAGAAPPENNAPPGTIKPSLIQNSLDFNTDTSMKDADSHDDDPNPPVTLKGNQSPIHKSDSKDSKKSSQKDNKKGDDKSKEKKETEAEKKRA